MTFSHTKTDTPTQSPFHRHMHSDFEILYFVDGDADYVVESAVYRLQRRDLLLIAPRTYHHLRLRSASRYERFVINFSEAELGGGLSQLLPDVDCIFNIPKDSFINHFFEAWSQSEEIFSKDELSCLIEQNIRPLLLFLKHNPPKESILPIQKNPTLDSILRFIEEHPERNISAASLSAQFYVSVSWIVHIFQKHLGISLMQYVAKKKMLYAQDLIRSGMVPTEAAQHCGFENYATFYRQYKKILNRTPKEDKNTIHI